MPLAIDKVSRGRRLVEIQELCGEGKDNRAFAARLNAAARELGLEEVWHHTRVSKVRTGTQDLSIEDSTVLARVDPKQRGWTWPAYGIVLRKNEDAWTVLARTAKRDRSA